MSKHFGKAGEDLIRNGIPRSWNRPAKRLAVNRAPLRDWKQLANSLVLGTNHYRWHALSLRICCDLVALRNKLPNGRSYLRDARRCVDRMLRLEEAAFIEYGNAFSLVVEASAGEIAGTNAWNATAEKLHALGHHLFAVALKWHQSLYAAGELQARLQSQAEAALRSEGCVAPEKLLNLILPLPRRRASPRLAAGQ